MLKWCARTGTMLFVTLIVLLPLMLHAAVQWSVELEPSRAVAVGVAKPSSFASTSFGYQVTATEQSSFDICQVCIWVDSKLGATLATSAERSSLPLSSSTATGPVCFQDPSLNGLSLDGLAVGVHTVFAVVVDLPGEKKDGGGPAGAVDEQQQRQHGERVGDMEDGKQSENDLAAGGGGITKAKVEADESGGLKMLSPVATLNIEVVMQEPFVPTYEWQLVRPWQSVPAGLEVQLPLDGSGNKMARIAPAWRLQLWVASPSLSAEGLDGFFFRGDVSNEMHMSTIRDMIAATAKEKLDRARKIQLQLQFAAEQRRKAETEAAAAAAVEAAAAAGDGQTEDSGGGAVMEGGVGDGGQSVSEIKKMKPAEIAEESGKGGIGGLDTDKLQTEAVILVELLLNNELLRGDETVASVNLFNLQRELVPRVTVYWPHSPASI